METELLYFAIKYQGDFNKIQQALLHKQAVNYEVLERMKQQLSSAYTTILSEDYPEQLKQIPSPPFVLFYYGDISLCKRECISIIGMRECSSYGRRMATLISGQLVCKEKVIVSGMAKGIDAYSHLGTIRKEGKTIAVLGCGIDYCYPKQNQDLYDEMKNNHLIMSEYPGMLLPRVDYFPVRNRIVAGLGQKLVVIEAKKRSGTMITVGHALEQGKEVICVPSNLDGYGGCNWLISQGASILVDIEDLF